MTGPNPHEVPDRSPALTDADPMIARIERAREQTGISQRELASRAGISVSGYRALVSGRTRSPSAATLRALAEPVGLELTLEPTTESL